MAYASQADVEVACGGRARLVELTDHAGHGGSAVDATVLAAAQQEADSWIDSFAQRVTTVPYSPVPDVIRRLAAAETVYRLKLYRDSVNEEDRLAHEERLAWLRDLAAATVSPTTAGAGGGSSSSGGGASLGFRSDDEDDITRGNLRGFW